MIKLSELKSALEKQLGSLNDRLSTLFTGKAPAKKAGKRRGRPPGKKKAAAKAPKAKKVKAPKAAKKAKAPKAAKAAKVKAPKAPKTTGRRGALKSQILKLLADAGAEGASVKDISAKLGVKNQNVHVWFSTTGKKLPEVTKIGEARYAYKVAGSTNMQPQA
ncbi:MAG: hypothetical protein ACREKL_08665 [Chthoniobacterales bacterium]